MSDNADPLTVKEMMKKRCEYYHNFSYTYSTTYEEGNYFANQIPEIICDEIIGYTMGNIECRCAELYDFWSLKFQLISEFYIKIDVQKESIGKTELVQEEKRRVHLHPLGLGVDWKLSGQNYAKTEKLKNCAELYDFIVDCLVQIYIYSKKNKYEDLLSEAKEKLIKFNVTEEELIEHVKIKKSIKKTDEDEDEDE